MAGTVHEIDDKALIASIRMQASEAAKELIATAKLKKGMIAVIGCSTSETLGQYMGTWSVPEVGTALYEGISEVFTAAGVYTAAQCCEHLNRAIVVERAAVPGYDIVNVVPQPKAGGSFATAAYAHMEDPVVVEEIRADAGIDIGGTLIGMHIKKVAVPLKLSIRKIGEANVTAARVRPKFIGGERAHYNEELK